MIDNVYEFVFETVPWWAWYCVSIISLVITVIVAFWPTNWGDDG